MSDNYSGTGLRTKEQETVAQLTQIPLFRLPIKCPDYKNVG